MWTLGLPGAKVDQGSFGSATPEKDWKKIIPGFILL